MFGLIMGALSIGSELYGAYTSNEARKKANDIEKRRRAVENIRQRKAQIAKQRVLEGQLTAQASATGTIGGSAQQGAESSLVSQLGSTLGDSVQLSNMDINRFSQLQKAYEQEALGKTASSLFGLAARANTASSSSGSTD